MDDVSDKLAPNRPVHSAEATGAEPDAKAGDESSIQFSIVIPAYNREDTIERCLRSCLDQQRSRFEVILVDDASTDGTVARAEALHDTRLRVIRLQENRQVSYARNRGSEAARGSWIVYVDSDDALLPGYLERMAGTIDRVYPEQCVIASPYLRDDGPVGPQPFPNKNVLAFPDYLRWQDEIVGSNDILICRHKKTCEQFPWPETRARQALTWMRIDSQHDIYFVTEPGGRVHTDAANRHTSDTSAAGLNRWRRDGKDIADSRVTLIEEFGAQLKQFSPKQHQNLMRSAGNLYLMAGHRWLGLKSMLRYLREYPFSPKGWLNLCLGLVHSRAILWATTQRKPKPPVSKRTPGAAARSQGA